MFKREYDEKNQANQSRKKIKKRICVIFKVIISVFVVVIILIEYISTFPSSSSIASPSSLISTASKNETKNGLVYHSFNASSKELRFWRDEILKNVTRLQEPKDCKSAQYLKCPKHHAGFGSIINIVSQCLAAGYRLSKTVVVHEDSYYRIKDFIYPISTCQDYYMANIGFFSFWPKLSSENYPSTGGLPQNGPLPSSVTPFLNTDNMQYPHGSFIGILQAYLFRGFPAEVSQFIDVKRIAMNVTRIDISCHIRRTDKISEAEPVDTDEYINKIIQIIEAKKGHQNDSYNVYLATDEPKVIKEIQSREYAPYHLNWIVNERGAQLAGRKQDERYEADPMMDLMFDLVMMSEAEHFVGTMSSNIGRLIFQLFANKYVDPSLYAHSLDINYYTYD